MIALHSIRDILRQFLTIREHWRTIGTSKVEGKGYAISKARGKVRAGLPILNRVHVASLDLLSILYLRETLGGTYSTIDVGRQKDL